MKFAFLAVTIVATLGGAVVDSLNASQARSPFWQDQVVASGVPKDIYLESGNRLP
jgi:hypothetical protein